MMDRIGNRLTMPPVRLAEPSQGARCGAPVGSVGSATKVAPRALPPSMIAAARDLATSPPVDTARVATIKAAISLGSYKIDPQAIAARMVDIDFPAKS